MPIPFLNSIKLNKNQVEDFCVFNYSGDPTLSSGADFGYLWLNTSATPKVLKFWDGTNYRTLIDSTTISSSTAGLATDLAGGGAGQIVYQDGINDTKFLAAGTVGQVLSSNGSSAPSWLNQSSLSVGSSTNIVGGSLGAIAVQTGVSSTNFLNVGTAGQVITSNGVSPQYVNQSTLSVGSATTAGSVTNALTAGTYLTSGGTFDGSVARTFAVDATDANTASKVVARDASGNFAAGTITATRVTGLSAPSAGSDAANRDYVDGVAQGLDVKASCLVATTADITLASPGAVTIDGIYSATDFTSGTTRILVKDQSAPAENGIYIWQGPAAAMTRSADANTWDELVGAFTFIERGTANADSGWVCTVNAGGTLGTTAVTWVKFSQAGSYTQGRGMVLDGTAFNFAQNTDYTANTIPYASGATTIGFISAGTADQVLRVPGAGGTPAFGAIDLTKSAAVTGALPIANGGTGATSFTQGQVLFAGASTISSSANLFWDNSNNRLGIGTATPRFTLDATGDIAIPLNSKVYAYYATATNYASFGANNSGNIEFTTGTSSPAVRQTIAADGVCTWSNVGGNSGTAMTLNGTGLGIGATPNYPLTVNGTIRLSGGNGTKVTWATDASSHFIQFSTTLNGLIVDGYDGVQLQTRSTPRVTVDSSGNVGIGTATPYYPLAILTPTSDTNVGFNLRAYTTGVDGAHTVSSRYTTSNDGSWANSKYQASAHIWEGDGTERMRLTAGGNLGLGVTPSAWSLGKAFEISSLGAGFWSYGNDNFYVNTNAYFNGGWKYAASSKLATSYQQYQGTHQWYTAASGTVGNAISGFASAKMTLDASGRLLLGAVSVPDTGLSFYNSNGTVGLGHYLTSTVAYVGTWTNHAFALASNGTERLRIKSTGQVNFVGQASDPAGAAGDVVYNSTSNRLKYHNGTAWVNTGTNKYSGALAGTGTSFTVTHNLGTRDVTVAVRKSGSTYDQVFTDVQMTDTNTVTIVFASSVTGSDYTVTVIG